MKKAIGIDLGTSNSVIAFKDTVVKIIRNKENEELTRSCIGLRNDEILGGRTAYQLLKNDQINTILSVKRLMGGAIKYKMLQAMIEDRDTLQHEYSFNATDLEEVRQVARMCPFESGPAVYYARALYGKISGEHEFFLNPCETANPYPNSGERTGFFPKPYEYDPTEEDDMKYPEGKNVQSIAVSNLNVYPNPASAAITVESSGEITGIEIINATGSTVKKQNVNKLNRVEIELKGCSKGIYLLKVYNGQNFSVQRFAVAE
ncbi:MAG: Hsp70 family protein [Bacteroidia bacterium]|nr:Hsp70 family protein [Bacteroidia bacterium]